MYKRHSRCLVFVCKRLRSNVNVQSARALRLPFKHRALDGAQDLEQFSQWLMALPNKERSVVKVSFEGSINLATAAALDELMASGADLFAGLWLRRRTSKLAVVPDQLDQDSVSLSGYARSTWDELLAASEGVDPIAQDALRLFYRLSGHQA